MKILGICGSQRQEEQSGVYKLVKAVLENTGIDYDLISLRGKKIQGCRACLGCVKTNVCVIKDDMAELREKIVEADAYVIGAPNFYTTMNAVTHAFLERWYQFRHREGDALWGKLAVPVGVGGGDGKVAATDMNKFFMYNFIEPLSAVYGQGAACCFTCGYGETCKVGAIVMMFGEGFKITPENTPDVTKCAKTMEAAVAAGKQLGDRLSNDHNREAVTQKMKGMMMEKFKQST